MLASWLIALSNLQSLLYVLIFSSTSSLISLSQWPLLVFLALCICLPVCKPKISKSVEKNWSTSLLVGAFSWPKEEVIQFWKKKCPRIWGGMGRVWNFVLSDKILEKVFFWERVRPKVAQVLKAYILQKSQVII